MTWNGVPPIVNTPAGAGCEWPLSTAACTYPESPTNDELDMIDWTQQMAIEIVWAASGRQFGMCRNTYRPCEAGCEAAPAIDAWSLVAGGAWFGWDPGAGTLFTSLRCGCGRIGCGCTRLESIELWHTRVRQIDEVQIDGVILDPTSYRLVRSGGRWLLARTDGDVWPACQDWEVANGEVGSWSVTLVHGRAVPYGGRVAAGVLASELFLAATCSDACTLPARIQSVTRAGQSIAFLDTMDFLDKGLTGIALVDLWIASVNPKRLQSRGRAYRADDPRRLARLRA